MLDAQDEVIAVFAQIQVGVRHGRAGRSCRAVPVRALVAVDLPA